MPLSFKILFINILMFFDKGSEMGHPVHIDYKNESCCLVKTFPNW